MDGHFTAPSSKYYIYIFTRGILCLYQPRAANDPDANAYLCIEKIFSLYGMTLNRTNLDA